MQFWPAIQIINQVAGEVGLAKVVTLFSPDDVNAVQSSQLLAALNSAGNELGFYYPWEQLRRQWVFPLVAGQTTYDLPPGWSYFMDQTQWDKTNTTPMDGPKSASDWAWLKNGNGVSFLNTRYRVMGGKFEIHPAPSAATDLSMEYVTEFWVQNSPSLVPNAAIVIADGDIIWMHPWLMVKYVKLKWLQLKNFPADAAAADYQRMFESMKGKDVGAEVLSLVHRENPVFIGYQNIPEGSWNV